MSFLYLIFAIIIAIAKYAWWIATPVVLFPFVRDLWLLSRMIRYGSSLDHVLLGIKVPHEVLKTPKAMEIALSGFHGAVDIIDFRDKWIEGKTQPTFALEIVGIDGNMHFFIRCERKLKNLVESKIYGQYPDVEIREVEDYVKQVPQDIPNKTWDIWGTDMALLKDSAYPIRTYEFFEDVEEERRFDPLASLAEVISHTKEGEQVWIQLLISPLFDFEWVGGSQQITDKLLGRKGPPPAPGFLEEVMSFFASGVGILFGKAPDGDTEEKRAEDDSNFMRLSRGEQKIIEAIEDKRAKAAFKTTLRTVYVARKDVMDRSIIASLQGIFRQVSDQNLNGLRISASSKPSSSLHYMKNMRNTRRKVRMFNMYGMRMLGILSEPFILNAEEIATLYHFPGHVVQAPGIGTTRMDARRGEPPSGLPIG